MKKKNVRVSWFCTQVGEKSRRGERGKNLPIITIYYKEKYGLTECQDDLETPQKREKEEKGEKKREKTAKNKYPQNSKKEK